MAVDWSEYGYEYDNREALLIAGIELDEVAEVIHYRDGENDSYNWLYVLRLNDGRYAYVTAWCDYTGWDCRAGGGVSYADSLEALIPEMDTEGRMAFGYEPTPDCGL